MMKRVMWAALVLAGVAALVAVVVVAATALSRERPIKVGILHSMSGTMADSGRPLVDAAMMAVDELNRRGGVLGRPVEAVVADGASDAAVFAREAERLIRDEGVVAIFGCWTSSGRKAVKAVVEKYDHLLFYPLQYEGLESSPNIIYLGSSPNQQIVPAVKWAISNVGRRFFLVGSDYLFPRAANAIIRDHVRRWRGQIAGEAYLPMGSTEVDGVIAEIRRQQPDLILNTLNGDSNVAFFTGLRAAGVTPRTIPTMSFSVAENELLLLPQGAMDGDYAAWSYFQSVGTKSNAQFVQDYRRRFGDTRVTSDPIEASHAGVMLWAAAAESAADVRPAAVRAAAVDRSVRGPGGMLYIDADNHHAWKPARIGRVLPSRQFEIVWSSDGPIRPEPFPGDRSREQWDRFLKDLYDGWKGNWVNPIAQVTITVGESRLTPQLVYK
jgi:urea transport system substrate-binding protein